MSKRHLHMRLTNLSPTTCTPVSHKPNSRYTKHWGALSVPPIELDRPHFFIRNQIVTQAKNASGWAPVRHSQPSTVFCLSATEKCGRNRQDWKQDYPGFVRPFGSLLKAKALWEELEGLGDGKKEGLPSELERSPVLSGWQDSNLRPPAPKASYLIKLY